MELGEASKLLIILSLTMIGDSARDDQQPAEGSTYKCDARVLPFDHIKADRKIALMASERLDDSDVASPGEVLSPPRSDDIISCSIVRRSNCHRDNEPAFFACSNVSASAATLNQDSVLELADELKGSRDPSGSLYLSASASSSSSYSILQPLSLMGSVLLTMMTQLRSKMATQGVVKPTDAPVQLSRSQVRDTSVEKAVYKNSDFPCQENSPIPTAPLDQDGTQKTIVDRDWGTGQSCYESHHMRSASMDHFDNEIGKLCSAKPLTIDVQLSSTESATPVAMSIATLERCPSAEREILATKQLLLRPSEPANAGTESSRGTLSTRSRRNNHAVANGDGPRCGSCYFCERPSLRQKCLNGLVDAWTKPKRRNRKRNAKVMWSVVLSDAPLPLTTL